jgi:hypothetical protein
MAGSANKVLQILVGQALPMTLPLGLGIMSFKKDGEWQSLIYLGEPINSEWTDFCPYMSPDGKHFFCSRRYSDPPESGWNGVMEGEVYWVDAEVIFDLDDQ